MVGGFYSAISFITSPCSFLSSGMSGAANIRFRVDFSSSSSKKDRKLYVVWQRYVKQWPRGPDEVLISSAAGRASHHINPRREFLVAGKSERLQGPGSIPVNPGKTPPWVNRIQVLYNVHFFTARLCRAPFLRCAISFTLNFCTSSIPHAQ